MGKIKGLYEKLKKVDMTELCAESTLSQMNQATNMNTDQLFQGERADGSKLPNYSPVSVQVFGKPNGPIRLYDTGDFYRGFIFANATGTVSFPLQIVSTDEKATELEQRYGSEIFGLNKSNQKELAFVYILPDLGRRFLNAIHI